MTRRSWTLRRKLVTGTSALVAAAFVVTSIVTIVALQSFVLERLDEQLVESLDLAVGAEGMGTDPLPQIPDDAAGPDDTIIDGGPAPRIGSLQAVLSSVGSVVSSSYVLTDGTEISLTEDQIDALDNAALQDRTPATVNLGEELGSFRVVAEAVEDATVVVGSSLDDVTATTSALSIILVVVVSITLAVAAVGLLVIVRRNLRPLDRVAGVAHSVSTLRLADGDVSIPVRVDPADTDPDTEVGRVGASLNELLGHIEHALTSRQHSEDQLRRFIADASHELRTPLASIRGYAQLSIHEGGAMTPTQEKSFDRIESEAQRMASLVDDLLLLARLDAGQSLRDEEVELTLLAVDAVSDAHAADPSREWKLEVSEDLISVRGDENRIRQVLANLLRNASSHTPPGTVVTTALTLEDDVALLSVADDGPGIDPGVADTLFERFARGDHSRNRDAGSTGLGLSIAHAIAMAHGGSITAESAPGRTMFSVRLPRVVQPDES